MKITNHRKMILGIVLSAILATVLLAMLGTDRSNYIAVLVTSFVGLILLRAIELNSLELRTSAKHLRVQKQGIHALERRLDQQNLALSALYKDHHSNELRVRRLLDWTRDHNLSTDRTNQLLDASTEKLGLILGDLRDAERTIDSFAAEQLGKEKRLHLLAESATALREDVSQIRADGHSNELRLRRLVEAIAALTEDTRKSEVNEHSNELRLRRLVDLTQRLDAKLLEFTETMNSQNEIQYKSDALIKYNVMEDLHDIKIAVNGSVDN